MLGEEGMLGRNNRAIYKKRNSNNTCLETESLRPKYCTVVKNGSYEEQKGGVELLIVANLEMKLRGSLSLKIRAR
jgi:hypothetical protein